MPASRLHPSIDVGCNDAFPTSFINLVLALPSTAGSRTDGKEEAESQEPCSKRRKLETSSTPSIHVARAEISFSRPSEDPANDFAKLNQDIGRVLLFNHADEKLWITTPPNSALGNFRFSFSHHRQEMGQGLHDILQVPDNRRRRDIPGAIWTSADLFVEQHGGIISLRLSAHLFWNETSSPYAALRTSRERKLSEKVIDMFFPAAACDDRDAWSPMDFYEAAHVPPKNEEESQSIDIPRLEANLYPYQKRSLQWLLVREGVRWKSSARCLHPLVDDGRGSDLDTFRVIQDANGHEAYLSDVFQTVTTNTTAFHQPGRAFRGGILAEEMGLGKTLEIIGLILLHERSEASLQRPPPGHERLVPSGATLIVTPASLRPQWISELCRHAPGLRVKDYTGRKNLKEKQDDDEKAFVNDLAGYDVVITTYSVLSAELHFAVAPPERSRRRERVYQRKTSPLVEISWWRVCLDEAQMIENGVSQAAALARLIPRINAWGITGTPVKDDVKDLRGLLSFLHYEPFCSVSEVWQALTSRHKALFKQIFSTISLRHTKALVRDEISLPPQKRYVISMPFTAVEEQHYQTMYKEMAEECGLSLAGEPLNFEWRLSDYEDVMRLWLNRLRQTILHPEVGVYGRRVLGSRRERPMRTVDEVLNAMLEQSEVAMRTDERTYLSSRLFLGQLFENSTEIREAVPIWEKVRDEAKEMVADARTKLQEAFGGEKGRQPSQSPDADYDDVEEDDGSDEEFGIGARGKSRISERRNRLREALELYHKAIFFCANAYFQIRECRELTEAESAEYVELKKLEEAGYEDARMIRRQILGESHRKATRLMDQAASKAKEQTFTEIPELVVGEDRGIESSRIIRDLRLLYGELNAQANVIDDWREQAIQLLLRPLVDGEEDVEITGEELLDSTSVQEELMVYVQVLRAIVADRQEAVSGQSNELIKHETKTSLGLAKNGHGPAPERLIELFRLKDEVKPASAQMSMRGIIGELRSLKSKLDREPGSGGPERGWRETMEGKIARGLLRSTQEVLAEQNKAAMALESEIEGFKRVMNARVEYYRQLQAVSDAVLPYDGPREEAVVARARKAVDDAHRRLLSGQAKHRYLLHLKESGSRSNEARMCVICQLPFSTGVLTVCGHEFCKECLMMWFKAHHNCPMCKRALKLDNLHDITIKPQELQVRSEGASGQSGPGSSSQGSSSQGSSSQSRSSSSSPVRKNSSMIYAEFNAEKLREMKNIELDGPSFTTKVDTMVRHLLWLRESDPGAKSIIFSQYKGFLAVLQNAFRRFRIGFASVDDGNGIARFKEDAAVECFLLHARAHSSGLNLVNASHVFLCEPLLNTALELQAIARVDRIGQQHETTVWLYMVSDTVEESIYNLSVRRRMEHMGRGRGRGGGEAGVQEKQLLDASIEAANTLEMEQAALSRLMSKDRTAGEMVSHGDLWECLFGHATAGSRSGGNPVLQERAVMSHLAGEAAEGRRGV